ncbi:MAG: hypothetical protein ACTHKC_05455 [Candidatus Nitrosocosmicus sp.]
MQRFYQKYAVPHGMSEKSLFRKPPILFLSIGGPADWLSLGK